MNLNDVISSNTFMLIMMVIGFLMALPWLIQVVKMLAKMFMVYFVPLKSVTIKGINENGEAFSEVVELNDTDRLVKVINSSRTVVSIEK